jgi:hypothetical protein
MNSQPVRSEAGRRRAEGQFKKKKKADAQTPRPDDAWRQTEADKIARLRALRLAKEAADKDTASRDAAAAAARKAEPRRRVSRPPVSDTSEPLVEGSTLHREP